MKKKKIIDNLILLIPILILIVISLFNMINCSNAYQMYKDYPLKQSIWFILGFVILAFIQIFKPKRLFKYSKYFYFINVLLLVLVLFFGKNINGSRAWFDLHFFSFQPSELMKFTLALYLAEEASKFKNNNIKNEFKFLVKLFIITIIPSILVFLEPDTGAIIIYFFIMLGVVLVSKIRKRWYLIICLLLTLSMGSFLYLYYFNKDLLIKIIGTSFFYRIDRILSFVNKDSFQLDRALIAIGSSGFLSNNNRIYVPEAPTDFIIALTINNFGIISFIVILLCFLILDGYFLIKLWRIKNIKYKMFFSAFLLMFTFAQIENIGMNLGLLPIIGLPLPFVSYGGTNIIVYFMFLGVLYNIKNM